MAKDKDLMQQAISNIQARKTASKPPAERDLMSQAISRLKGTPTQENIWDDPATWAAPEIVGKIPGLKSLVGTGQELAEFATGIPRLFGADIARPPKAVETGLGEKVGAGILEYMLGGAGAKAIPAIGKGFQALGKVPAVGRALAAPFTQRAVGMGAMGALESPEHPVRGAALSAGLGAGAEVGFKVPGKALDVMTKAKWSPFHNMMMPHIQREFNEFLGKTAQKLGLSTEHDIDKSLFDTLEAKYDKATKSASSLYDRADSAFRGIKYPVYWKEGLRGRTIPLIKDIQESYGKAPDTFGVKIKRTMKELENKIDDPIAFRRKIHAAERDAVRSGNYDLLDSLQAIDKSFDKSIGNLAGKTKDPALSKALTALRKADTYFKDNVVPYRKRASVKLEEGKRKSIPTEFFKAHSKDSSKNLGKSISGDIEDLEHISKVAPEIKEHLAFNHLKEGMDNPERFIQEYSGLTKEQKDNIFTKDEISRFDKFKKIYNKNPAAFRESAPATAIAAARGYPLKKVGEGISAIPRIRESYIGEQLPPVTLGGMSSIMEKLLPKKISGKPIIPTSKEAVRDIVMGALLGTTKD